MSTFSFSFFFLKKRNSMIVAPLDIKDTLLCIPMSKLVSCAFSPIPICLFLIQRIFHLLAYLRKALYLLFWLLVVALLQLTKAFGLKRPVHFIYYAMYLLQLMSFVFSFDSQIYKGRAMGTKMVLSYANCSWTDLKNLPCPGTIDSSQLRHGPIRERYMLRLRLGARVTTCF